MQMEGFLETPESSTRIKDAGIAICHSRGSTFLYTAGSGNGLEEAGGGGYAYRVKESHIILNQMVVFESKIEKIKVCSLQMSRKPTDFRRRRPAGAKLVIYTSTFNPKAVIMAPQTRKMRVLARQAPAACPAGSRHQVGRCSATSPTGKDH